MKDAEIERLNNLKKYEVELKNKNIKYICGIDEAGRGPLAGPVVVASVIMNETSMLEGVNDSKKVSAKKREKLYNEITTSAISWSVGIVDHKRIDDINILNATKEALNDCIKKLEIKPEHILVDALKDIDTLGIPYTSIIQGDAKSYTIACASIIAKVTRDRIMEEMDYFYPKYNFSKHKGYGTAEHIKAIKENGICSIHRKSFVKNFI